MSTRRKISPAVVKSLVPGEIVWDTELSRFGVRRRAARISYVLKVRIRGRQKWITLGQHGPLTPIQARDRARKTLAEIDLGIDPTREREAQRNMPTMAEFADRWLAEHVGLKRKSSTLGEYRRIIAKHLIPALGRVPVDRVKRADVDAVHIGLAAHPYQANRVVATLSSIMTYAERIGHRPPASNPCRGLERFSERKRRRPLTSEELARLWRYLREVEGIENLFAITAIRLLLLTGCRKSEVLQLQWKDVDLDLRVLRLRDSKTGPREVVLSDQACSILRAVPRVADNPFVIVGNSKGCRLVNLMKPWKRIRNVLEIPEVRLHDLRHTTGSRLARKAPLIVVRDTLGHAAIQTTSGYSHAATDDVRAAVDELAREITGEA